MQNHTIVDQQRFWAKVKKTAGCWQWQGSLKRGYGVVKTKRDAEGKQKAIKAHRIAYELSHGPIPAGLMIDHTCHNRACVNPEHLRLATTKQNAENRSGPQASLVSGSRGVYWKARDQRWEASVKHNGKQHHGGYFTDRNEAAEAARDLRQALFTHSHN